jgi:hypothetical protein
VGRRQLTRHRQHALVKIMANQFNAEAETG